MSTDRRSWRWLFASALSLCAAILLLAGPVRADPPGRAAKARTAAELARSIQAQAWTFLYAGQHHQAAKRVAPLLRARFEWARVEAAHCQARCLWAVGSRPARAKARQIWAQLRKASTLAANLQRVVIARALVAEADKKDPQAIELLEGVLKRGFPDTCTAEAAIELGRLYAKARRFKDARRAYDFGISFLQHQVKREVPADAAEPFLMAAKQAKDRLKYLESAGRELFEKAEKLRSDKKFRQAIQLYRKILKDFPDSDFAPRSELHIGHCLIGLRQGRHALAHWKKFIATAPAGMWRGQAYVGLIDLYLEHLLDVAEATKYAEMASNLLPKALADEKAKASWGKVAFGVHFRAGMAAYLRGDGPSAVPHLESAKEPAGRSKALIEGLNRLIAVAKAGLPVVPPDVSEGSRRAMLPASIGTVYYLLGSLDHAQGLFDRVLAGRFAGLSTAQSAFATFGKAACVQGRGEILPAKAYYIASVKSFPPGTWHDETLYRIAGIVHRQAWETYGKEPEPKKDKDRAKRQRPPPPVERKKLEEQRKARLAQYLKARGEALPHWLEIVKRYPKSPRVEPAKYHLGVLACEAEQWNDAAKVLADFVKTYPNSRWAGDAYVRLIDINLERLFELPAARAYATAGVNWAKTQPAKSASASTKAPPWALADHDKPLGSNALKSVKYDVYLRAGVIGCLVGNFDHAIRMLSAAKPLELRTGCAVRESHLPQLGLDFLLRKIRQNQELTAPDVLVAAKTERQRTAVKLADLYMHAMRPGKTSAIYERILAEELLLRPVSPGIEAYAIMQLARARMRQDLDQTTTLEGLTKLYQTRFATYPWTADGIFRLGVFTYNITQDSRKSTPHYQYVFTRYPEHCEAERAMFYYCLDAVELHDLRLALRACRGFTQKYPNSRWNKRVQSLINMLTEQMGSNGKGER